MDDDYSPLGTGLMSGAGTGAAIGGPWGAAIGGAIGLGQSAYGIFQKHKANQLAAANKRPTYEIPSEIQQNLNQAQSMALEGLPSEQKQQYINNLQRSQNFGLGAASDRKGGLAGLGGLVQQGNDASMNLLSADSQAQYKDKAFGYNQADKYQENAAAARGMAGAGLQNTWGGLGTVAGAAQRGALGIFGKRGPNLNGLQPDTSPVEDDGNIDLGLGQ